MLKRRIRGLLGSRHIYPVLRRRALRADPVTILCYHTLGPDRETMDAWTVLRAGDFQAHISVLQEHYEIVSLDEALEPAAPDSRPRAVLTFDDGDVGLFNHLLPMLEGCSLPVTIYIATGQIEVGRPYWFDRVMNALQGPGPFDIDLREAGLQTWTIGLDTGPARWATISDILETLKRLPPERREVLADDLIARAPSASGMTPLAPMSLDQLKTLAANPNVTIGAHSHCHNLLDQIPLDAATESVRRSRDLLQDWTGQPVLHFAYPNGNQSAPLRQALGRLGFASAAVLDNRLSEPGQDRHELSRLAIGRYDDAPRFQLRLVGL